MDKVELDGMMTNTELFNLIDQLESEISCRQETAKRGKKNVEEIVYLWNLAHNRLLDMNHVVQQVVENEARSH